MLGSSVAQCVLRVAQCGLRAALAICCTIRGPVSDCALQAYRENVSYVRYQGALTILLTFVRHIFNMPRHDMPNAVIPAVANATRARRELDHDKRIRQPSRRHEQTVQHRAKDTGGVRSAPTYGQTTPFIPRHSVNKPRTNLHVHAHTCSHTRGCHSLFVVCRILECLKD